MLVRGVALVTLIYSACVYSAELPPLPANFSISFAVVDFLSNVTVVVEDLTSQTLQNSTGIHLWKGGIGSNLVIRRDEKDYLYHDGHGNCSRSKSPIEVVVVNPLLLPPAFFNRTALTLYDLWNYLKQFSWNKTDLPSEHESRQLQNYSTSIRLSKNNVIDVNVVLFQPWLSLPSVKARIPRSVEIVAYTNSKLGTTNPVMNVSFFLFNYKLLLDEASIEHFLLPPEGVYCSGLKNDSFPEIKLQNFMVSVEILQHKLKMPTEIKLFYSADKRLASFTNMNSSVLPFNQGLNLSSYEYVVTHDFDSGLQYVVNGPAATCVNVTPIPLTAGTGKLSSEKGQPYLAFKNATEVLLKVDRLNFGYVGKRQLDDMMLEVWVAKEAENNTCFVHEVWFNKAIVQDEVLHASNVVLPWALRVYNSCVRPDKKNPKVPQERTTYTFYNFLPFNSTLIPWKRFDVSTCLKYDKNESYMTIHVNATVDKLYSTGIEVVENFLRTAIAAVAGVSPLRVSRFMFQPDGNRTMVFFQISNVSGVVGTRTEFFQAEKDLAAARHALNETLQRQDVTVRVPRRLEKDLVLVIMCHSLRDACLLCHGGEDTVIINYMGYTGGSMAGLGISMLLLGSFFGLIIGFYLWKRHRGIAYQMYE
ncbi:hypothetical protein M514_06914 [Trichuris suis]|uniref:Uncharacterized protein n=1 Tax=Trichuris suis TaxID=68888 RepID=A0A085NLL1_9BILA|nr:hypothetical protein M513_06914 [Trichuris suis]KFD70357.1 hypothetical protein M514_06914 [Trichuris suis]